MSKLLLDAQRSGIVSAGAFLEYVSGLRAAGSREGEARADSSGAVQIMSVHQAKGLEFPVIVIGDAGGGGGGRSTLLLDGELGIIPALSSDAGAPLVWKLAMQREASKEDAESDRLLYVAATRARERLLISGHVTVKRDGSLGPAQLAEGTLRAGGADPHPGRFRCGRRRACCAVAGRRGDRSGYRQRSALSGRLCEFGRAIAGQGR